MSDQEVVIVGKDGREHVFPAGFDPKKAAGIVSSQLETPEDKGSTTSRVLSGAGNAIVEGVKGTAALAGVRGPVAQFQSAKGLIDAQIAAYRKAKAAQAEGHTSEMVGHSVAAAVPVVGPMAERWGEMIGSGEAPEAAGEMIVGAAVPAIAKGGSTAAGAARSGAEAVGRGASTVASAVPTGARAALLGRAVKYAAKQVMPPFVVEGADLVMNAIKKHAAEPTPVTEAVTTPAVAPAPVAPPVEAPAPSQPVKATRTAAEQLRDTINGKELTRVRKELGTNDVKIARYEPRQGADGKFLGVLDPVYVMPPEFVEHAQTMGLRARAHTALEKSHRLKAEAQ